MVYQSVNVIPRAKSVELRERQIIIIVQMVPTSNQNSKPSLEGGVALGALAAVYDFFGGRAYVRTALSDSARSVLILRRSDRSRILCETHF